MREYVLDANAVLRYLGISGGIGGERVRALVEQSESGFASVMISAVNLGEVFYVMRRSLDEASAKQHVQQIQRAVTTIPADAAHAVAAARLKHRHKMNYADCFAAALAMGRGAILVSADRSFEQCGHALKWLPLPPYRG